MCCQVADKKDRRFAVPVSHNKILRQGTNKI
nr:MAG TPA: hypothetical protein [Caudoviricetes sp.]